MKTQRSERLGAIDNYGWSILRDMGYDQYDLVEKIEASRTNPVVEFLRSDPRQFVKIAEAHGGQRGLSLDGVSRLVIICQMILFDIIGGPEQDNKEKGLRRHWYTYFKPFAQMFAFAAGKTRANAEGVSEMVDLQWSGRLSKVYAEFVDSKAFTYKQMWVEDASRMMDIIGSYNSLLPELQIIVAVEKDSLFSDFKAASRGLGAIAQISGKGKNSKAAAELMLRGLGWNEDWNQLTGHGKKAPLVITLSDFDYDGHAVIWPTFAEQLRRYLPEVDEERIGVQPEQVAATINDPWIASYQVKSSNQAYVDWARKNALFWATCKDCGHEQFVIGYVEDETYGPLTYDACSSCEHESLVLDTTDEPHGYEVESLRSGDYYRAMVKAVLRAYSFETIVARLRRITIPPVYSIQDDMTTEILELNARHKKIEEAIELLQTASDKLKDAIGERVSNAAEEFIKESLDEITSLGDDPEPKDFEDHVVNAGRSGYGNPWRPFSIDERKQFVIDALRDNDELMSELGNMDIEDYDQVYRDVTDLLQE